MGESTSQSNEGRLHNAGRRRPVNSLRATLIEFLAPVAIAIIAVVATALVALTVIRYLDVAGNGTDTSLQVVGGLVVAFGLSLAVFYRAAFSMMPRRIGTRSDLAARYAADLSDATYVGVSPGEYRFDLTWDLGFLVLSDESMRYYGDRASFELGSDQVESVELIGDWWKPWDFLRLRISWREPLMADCRQFTMIMHDARSPREFRRRMLALLEQITAWRESATPVSSPHQSLGPPPVLADEHIQIPRIPALCGLLTHVSALWAMVCLVGLMIYSLMVNTGALHGPTSSLGLLPVSAVMVVLIGILIAWMDGRD